MSVRIDAPDDELPYGNPRITSLLGMLSVLSWQPDPRGDSTDDKLTKDINIK